MASKILEPDALRPVTWRYLRLLAFCSRTVREIEVPGEFLLQVLDENRQLGHTIAGQQLGKEEPRDQREGSVRTKRFLT